MAVVTISRQFGAGGRTLGERLAKRLGYRFVHEDMIKDVAKKMRVSDKKVEAFEKWGSNKLMKFLDKVVSRDFIDRLVTGKYTMVDEESYVGAVKTIIEDLYAQGDTVIIGRGSQFILKGFENAWHVLLVANLTHRVLFLRKKYGLTEYEAEKAIRNASAIRSQFLSFYAEKQEHDNPLSYDLVLNMERISMEKAEDMIVQLVSPSS